VKEKDHELAALRQSFEAEIQQHKKQLVEMSLYQHQLDDDKKLLQNHQETLKQEITRLKHENDTLTTKSGKALSDGDDDDRYDNDTKHTVHFPPSPSPYSYTSSSSSTTTKAWEGDREGEGEGEY
jgi:hypothetical protein